MKNNGKRLCTVNYGLVDIMYLSVKDRVDNVEFEIQYCPTKIMLADFFTAPFQGGLFSKFRELIMVYKQISYISPVTSLIKEIVLNNK